MATAYCIDVSGSISENQIEAAFDFVRGGFEPGDLVIVFDVNAVVVDLNDPFKDRCFSWHGGTDAKAALKLAKDLGANQTICITDGYMLISTSFVHRRIMLNISQVFDKALTLFQDKSRWAQDFYQYDEHGIQCEWKKGYSFCALGAVNYFTDGFPFMAQCALQRVSEHLYGQHIQLVNDSPDGYEKVLKALEFARDFWAGRDPTEEEVGMSIVNLERKWAK